MDDGVMVINLLTEDANSNPAQQDDVQAWAESYGLTMPVVADPGGSLMFTFAGPTATSVSLPFSVLIDEKMVIDTVDGGSIDDAIRLATR